MTFETMARAILQGTPFSERQLAQMTEAITEGYCISLRNCSYRIGGVNWIRIGTHDRLLDEVIAEIQRIGMPYTGSTNA